LDHFVVRDLLTRIEAEDSVKDRLILVRAEATLVFEVVGHQFTVMTPYPFYF
jgi:hypothetical protein